MTTARSHGRAKLARDPFDLALIEAVRANIVAAHDLLRATAALKTAELIGNESRHSDAIHARNNAKAKVAVAKSNLEAAIQIEAENRA